MNDDDDEDGDGESPTPPLPTAPNSEDPAVPASLAAPTAESPSKQVSQ